jgi:hypothetical protein
MSKAKYASNRLLLSLSNINKYNHQQADEMCIIRHYKCWSILLALAIGLYRKNIRLYLG